MWLQSIIIDLLEIIWNWVMDKASNFIRSVIKAWLVCLRAFVCENSKQWHFKFSSFQEYNKLREQVEALRTVLRVNGIEENTSGSSFVYALPVMWQKCHITPSTLSFINDASRYPFTSLKTEHDNCTAKNNHPIRAWIQTFHTWNIVNVKMLHWSSNKYPFYHLSAAVTNSVSHGPKPRVTIVWC